MSRYCGSLPSKSKTDCKSVALANKLNYKVNYGEKFDWAPHLLPRLTIRFHGFKNPPLSRDIIPLSNLIESADSDSVLYKASAVHNVLSPAQALQEGWLFIIISWFSFHLFSCIC